MRFLCVSDIHGHADALARVLEEARHREFNQVLVCGDLLFGGPEPLKTWRLLLEHHAVCVQGVSDRALAALDPAKLSAVSKHERDRLDRLKATHAELGELIIARLGKLPTTARLPVENGAELVVVHGSLRDPTEPFTPDMTDDEVNALIADDPADVIVCGGSHVPFQRTVDEVHVVGVGSVGEAPGGGVAHATLLDTSPFGIAIEQFVVELEERDSEQ